VHIALGQVPRYCDSNASYPSLVEFKAIVWKKKGNEKMRFREQQRTVIDGQSRSANNLLFTPMLPYIPIHQQSAIHNFFDRIRGIDPFLDTCSTCKERYHGMHLKGTQCKPYFTFLGYHLQMFIFAISVLCSCVAVS
jgi:hypothetical protein